MAAMTRSSCLTLGLLALAVLATPARAAFDCYVQVAQPHDQPEAGGIGLMYVTYELMLGSASPGVEIGLTCAPGPVAVDRGSGYTGVENRNGANEYGFKVNIEDLSDPERWKGSQGKQYIDTMTVTLDVRAASRKVAAKVASDTLSAYLYQDDLDQTVHCTVDCILDNASRSRPPIHHLRLRIAGPKRYSKLARVYDITPAPGRKKYY
jgi:hypothetical protein